MTSSFTDGITPDLVRDRIVAGPDGNMWFAESGAIGRITPAGVVTEFDVGGDPEGLAWGPDGNLWFTRYRPSSIGRMTPTGRVTAFSAGLTPGSAPLGIAAGPVGNMWFAAATDHVGRITPAGNACACPRRRASGPSRRRSLRAPAPASRSPAAGGPRSRSRSRAPPARAWLVRSRAD